MKMMLILLFLSDFWLGILKLKKELKKELSEKLIPKRGIPIDRGIGGC